MTCFWWDVSAATEDSLAQTAYVRMWRPAVPDVSSATRNQYRFAVVPLIYHPWSLDCNVAYT